MRYPFSVTVVRGCRAAVPGVTNRPVMALRWCVPVLRLPPVSVTVVRGCRAAVPGVTYRPLIALRWLLALAMEKSFARGEFWLDSPASA
jgi:hypothetical protein